MIYGEIMWVVVGWLLPSTRYIYEGCGILVVYFTFSFIV